MNGKVMGENVASKKQKYSNVRDATHEQTGGTEIKIRPETGRNTNILLSSGDTSVSN